MNVALHMPRNVASNPGYSPPTTAKRDRRKKDQILQSGLYRSDHYAHEQANDHQKNRLAPGRK